MAVVFSFPVDVGGEVFCDIVGEVVGILHLQKRLEKVKVCVGRRSFHSAPAPRSLQRSHQIIHAVLSYDLMHVLVSIYLVSCGGRRKGKAGIRDAT